MIIEEEYTSGCNVAEIVTMTKEEYQQMTSIMNQLADKLELVMEENKGLKKNISRYTAVNVNEALSKYTEILDINIDIVNGTEA